MKYRYSRALILLMVALIGSSEPVSIELHLKVMNE